MMTRGLIKEEDLLPVEEKDGIFICGNSAWSMDTIDADKLTEQAIRFLSVAKEVRNRQRAQKEKLREEWLVEKILPLSLVMYKQYQNDYISEERWMEHYLNKNTVTLRWVRTAETAYKHINPEDTDK